MRVLLEKKNQNVKKKAFLPDENVPEILGPLTLPHDFHADAWVVNRIVLVVSCVFQMY